VTWPGGDPPQSRKRLRLFGDWAAVVASVGTRSGRRLGSALDRRPVALPLAALGVGVALIVGASLLSPGAGNPPMADLPHLAGGRRVSSYDLLVAVSVLFAAGGVMVLAGLAGLVSAAVVHIVKRSERR